MMIILLNTTINTKCVWRSVDSGRRWPPYLLFSPLFPCPPCDDHLTPTASHDKMQHETTSTRPFYTKRQVSDDECREKKQKKGGRPTELLENPHSFSSFLLHVSTCQRGVQHHQGDPKSLRRWRFVQGYGHSVSLYCLFSTTPLEFILYICFLLLPPSLRTASLHHILQRPSLRLTSPLTPLPSSSVSGKHQVVEFPANLLPENIFIGAVVEMHSFCDPKAQEERMNEISGLFTDIEEHVMPSVLPQSVSNQGLDGAQES